MSPAHIDGITPIPTHPAPLVGGAELCTICQSRIDPVLQAEGGTTHPLCEHRRNANLAKAGLAPAPGPAPAFPAPVLPLTSRQVGDQIRAELITALKAQADNAPRSLQRSIGPSEVGSPCRRRLAYKLLGATPVNVGGDPFASWAGTQMHEGMEVAMTLANAGEPDIRWVTESRVHVTDTLAGSADLIDRKLLAVVDHKFVGKTSHDRARRHGPSEQYRIQANLYAHGLRKEGVPIEHVVIAYWLRTGFKTSDLHVWAEPYNEQVALDALAALDALRALVDTTGWNALAILPAVDAHCTFCPMWQPNSADLARGCPGAGTAPKRDSLEDLIAN